MPVKRGTGRPGVLLSPVTVTSAVAAAHRMFSAKRNIRVLELQHRCHISSHGWVGRGGQACGFQVCFHLVEKSVAQISPAPGFVLFTYKEGTENQASLTQ